LDKPGIKKLGVRRGERC